MTKSRIFLYILLSFIGGVALQSFVNVSVFLMLAGLLAGIFFIIAGARTRRVRVVVWGALVIAGAFGIFWFSWHVQSQPDLSRHYETRVIMRGIVWDEPTRSEKVQRVKLKVLSVNEGALAHPMFVLVTLERYPRYSLGEELIMQGTLERPENFSDFDYVSYLARDGIFSILSFPDVEKTGEIRGGVRSVLSRAKHSFEQNIDAVLPDPHAAFLKGLLLGERESLPDELLEAFSRTGTTHIIALSGYNITPIARFFMGFLLFLTLPFQYAFWLASGAIVLFVILVGASPSIVRAGLMGVLVLVAAGSGRMYNIRNALVFAAAVMIFQNPMILRFDAAFQLSFLATTGLVYGSPFVAKFLDRFAQHIRRLVGLERASIKRGVRETFIEAQTSQIKRAFVETLSAQLAVLPLIIFLFGRLSVVSPFVNVLVVLAIPYTMALGFGAGVLGFVLPIFSQIIAWASWALLEYKIQTIDRFASFGAASVELAPWVLVPILAGYGAIIFRMVRSKSSKKDSY